MADDLDNLDGAKGGSQPPQGRKLGIVDLGNETTMTIRSGPTAELAGAPGQPWAAYGRTGSGPALAADAAPW